MIRFVRGEDGKVVLSIGIGTPLGDIRAERELSKEEEEGIGFGLRAFSKVLGLIEEVGEGSDGEQKKE